MPNANDMENAKIEKMQSEFDKWRDRLYRSMQLPRDGKIKAFAEEEGVSTQWVRQVLDGTFEDVKMLERCVVFLEKWNEQKLERMEKHKEAFVQRAANSAALAYAI